MTTARSARRLLQKQADTVAFKLKQAERGRLLGTKHDEKIIAARAKESVTFAIVMDDKVLKVEMTWTKIRDTSEEGIAEFIVNQMMEAKHAVH